MTIRLVHSYKDEEAEFGYTTQITYEKNVNFIEFEDQRAVKNGMWIHIYKNDGSDLWIEFEPDEDYFQIFE